MAPKLPEYRGAYERLFLPPTLILGVGRWGAEVCNQFFKQLESVLQLSCRSSPPEGSPKRLSACFATAAIVRAPDVDRLPLKWARYVQTWPEEAEDESRGVLSDIDADLATTARWQIPKVRFDEQKDALMRALAQELPQLLGGVSSQIWAAGCDALGLNPVGHVGLARKWVVAVGSLCEPDAAVVLRHLRRFTVEQIMHGDDSQVTNLALVDCGLPDHPRHANELWIQCPDSILAQLLQSVSEYSVQRDVLTFFTTSNRLQSLNTPAVVRQEVAIGLLKCFFLGTLLQQREEVPQHWKLLSSAGVSAGSSSLDRVTAYIEAVLDPSNLPALITREVLAEWKRRLTGESPDTVEHLEFWIDAYASGEGTGIDQRLMTLCLREAAANGTLSTLDRLRLYVTEEKNRVVENLDRQNRLRAESGSDPVPRPTLLESLKVWLRLSASAKESPSPELPGALSTRIERYDHVLVWLESLREVGNELVRPEADFQDRTSDHHFELTETGFSTLLIRYRRIPLNTCPPALRAFVLETVEQVPLLLAGICTSLVPPSLVLDNLRTRLKDIWGSVERRFPDAERRWQELGMAQWLKYDPSLVTAVAKFAYRGLNPLWNRLPRPEPRWDGFLTVFDFGVRPGGEPGDATRESFAKVSQDLASLHFTLDPINRFGLHWPIMAALQNGAVHFESWPFLYSFGLLWTDFPVVGRGFSEDWDKSQMELRAQLWRKANAQEAQWIGSAELEPLLGE